MEAVAVDSGSSSSDVVVDSSDTPMSDSVIAEYGEVDDNEGESADLLNSVGDSDDGSDGSDNTSDDSEPDGQDSRSEEELMFEVDDIVMRIEDSPIAEEFVAALDGVGSDYIEKLKRSPETLMKLANAVKSGEFQKVMKHAAPMIEAGMSFEEAYGRVYRGMLSYNGRRDAAQSAAEAKRELIQAEPKNTLKVKQKSPKEMNAGELNSHIEALIKKG